MPRFASPVPAPNPRKAVAPAAAPGRAAPRPKPALAQTLQLRAAASTRAAAKDGPASGAGLPEGLKAGVEALSGIAMGDVRVHRNSPEPAKLGALAYAKGSDIHLGPGQDPHLPHEAWHVVQQKQGRVRPTLQFQRVGINDDSGLEREADLMGARALIPLGRSGQDAAEATRATPTSGTTVMQCKWIQSLHGLLRWDTLLGGMQWHFNERADQFHYVIADKSAVPSDWWELVSAHVGKPLTEDQFHDFGFATIDVDQREAEVYRGREELAGKTKEESETRLGFEIENAWHFESQYFEGYKAYVNLTLLTYVDEQYGPLLEFLLDDPHVNSKKSVDFQGEFRTTPLSLGIIGQAVRDKITSAIKLLKPKTLFHVESELPKGWHPSAEYRQLCGFKFSTQHMAFSLPPLLAQHVTSSINVGAYAKLFDKDDPKQELQGALYPAGAGSAEKTDLYRNILAAMSAKSTIDATTVGRNKAKAMVKSPIEAMLAAEDALDVSDVGTLLNALAREKRPDTAQTARTDIFQIGRPDIATQSIVEGGSYPSIQGEQGRGYLAIAEKLQPPLIDPVNRELRVLVEHRADDLRDAVNFILTGQMPMGKDKEKQENHIKTWTTFREAAAKMDMLASK